MRDRRTRENKKHAPRAAFLLFVDSYIALESVIQSSFEFFVSIHLLLVFDFPFSLPRGSSAYKSAWSSYRLKVAILISVIRQSLRFLVQRYNKFQSPSSESKPISEPGEIEDIVCQKKVLYLSCRVFSVCRLWTPSERIKLENVFDTRAILRPDRHS